MLTIHVTISLLGLALATVMFFRPTRRKITVSYIMLIGTFLSGSFLVLSSGTYILKACVMGLAYFAFVAAAIHASEAKILEKSKTHTTIED